MQLTAQGKRPLVAFGMTMLNALQSYLHRVSERRKSYLAGRRGTACTIEHNADELKVAWLSMENERGEFALKWHEVVRLEVFKRDVWAVDLICLAIVLAENKEVEINEEMKGWEPLVRKLPEYLSGCKEFDDWYDVVARPPFKENLTVIYRHDP
jgi:hypothetical protein